MARRRYQKGSLVPKTGIPRNGLWVGRWREDVIQVDGTITRPYKWEVLGTIRDYPTRRLALRALEARLSTVNNPTYRARPTATLAANAAQFTSSQSGSEIQQYHYSLTLFQLTVDKLGKLRIVGHIAPRPSTVPHHAERCHEVADRLGIAVAVGNKRLQPLAVQILKRTIAQVFEKPLPQLTPCRTLRTGFVLGKDRCIPPACELGRHLLRRQGLDAKALNR